MEKLRINVGCRQTPTVGWRNFDNSLSLRLSKPKLLQMVLRKIGIVNKEQACFIHFAREHCIEYGDATRGLPLPSGSVEVLYSSHMLEHLDRQEATLFLMEARRILCSGGIVR